MRKSIASGIIVVTVLAIVGAVLVRGVSNYNGTDHENMSAAFRDGSYLGSLAATRGERPHISIGRWAEPSDQESFATGYARAYEQRLAGLTTESANAALRDGTNAAFRDGLYVGKLDADEGRAVHVSLGRWSSAEDRASFSSGYAQAYERTSLAREELRRNPSQASLLR